MNTRIRWRLGTAFSVLALTVALVVIPGSQVVVAQADTLPAEFRNIPADATVAIHVDAATLWKSKLGQTVLDAKLPELEQLFTDAEKNFGITAQDVQSLTMFMPNITQPRDMESFGVRLMLKKPFDKAKIAGILKKNITNIVELDGVFVDKAPVAPNAPKGQAPQSMVVDLSQPMQITMLHNLDAKYRKDQPAGSSPLLSQLKASSGSVFTVAVNLNKLPSELRGDMVPAEARAFQPLVKCDTMVASGRLADDNLNINIKFLANDKVKTAEAKQSLTAGVSILELIVSSVIQQTEKSTEPRDKAFTTMLKSVGTLLKNTKIASTDTEATADANMKIDSASLIMLTKSLADGIGSVKAANARATTQNNLKQMALAMHNHYDANGGLPSAAICDKNGKPLLSWRVAILPYIEQQALYQKFKLNEPWDSAHNKKVFEENPMPSTYLLNGNDKKDSKTTHFRVFYGNGALYELSKPVKFNDVKDGTSNTIMIVTAEKAVPWSKPEELQFDPKGDPKKLLNFENGVCNIAFADGSVRVITNKLDSASWKGLITRDGGEVVNINN